MARMLPYVGQIGTLSPSTFSSEILVDPGGTFWIGSRPEVAIHRDRLRCVVQYVGGLAGTCVIDLYVGVSTTPVEMLLEDKTPNFLEITSEDSRGRRYGYSPGGDSKIALGFPR